MGVIDLDRDAQVLRRPVQKAAGVAAPIVGHHRVPVGELLGQTRIRAGVIDPAADQQQDRAGALDIVVQGRRGYLQGVRLRRLNGLTSKLSRSQADCLAF